MQCNAAKVQSEPTYIPIHVRAVSLPSPRDRTTQRSRPCARHIGKPKLQSYLFHRETSSSSPAHRRIYVCRCISGEYVHISSKRNVTSHTHAHSLACISYVHYAHTHTHTHTYSDESNCFVGMCSYCVQNQMHSSGGTRDGG